MVMWLPSFWMIERKLMLNGRQPFFGQKSVKKPQLDNASSHAAARTIEYLKEKNISFPVFTWRKKCVESIFLAGRSGRGLKQRDMSEPSSDWVKKCCSNLLFSWNVSCRQYPIGVYRISMLHEKYIRPNQFWEWSIKIKERKMNTFKIYNGQCFLFLFLFPPPRKIVFCLHFGVFSVNWEH